MSLLFDPQTPCRLRCNPSFQIRTNPLKCSGSSSITLIHHPSMRIPVHTTHRYFPTTTNGRSTPPSRRPPSAVSRCHRLTPTSRLSSPLKSTRTSSSSPSTTPPFGSRRCACCLLCAALNAPPSPFDSASGQCCREGDRRVYANHQAAAGRRQHTQARAAHFTRCIRLCFGM